MHALVFEVRPALASHLGVVSVETDRSVRHIFGWVTYSEIHAVREITYYMPVTIHCYINKNLVGRYIYDYCEVIYIYIYIYKQDL